MTSAPLPESNFLSAQNQKQAGSREQHPLPRLPVFFSYSVSCFWSRAGIMNSLRHIQRAPVAPLRDSLLRNTTSAARPSTQSRFLSSRTSHINASVLRSTLTSSPLPAQIPLRSPFLPSTIRVESIASGARNFHVSSSTRQQKQPEERDPKVQPEPTEEKEKDKVEDKKETEGEPAEEGKKEGEEKSDKKEKKEDLPPPPPHGDKTPWQVFLETMQTELNQSKEWNESTKALASSAHQLAESESVRKARQAYEATSGAVSSTAGKVAKTTAQAIGKGAQWTWETPVVKGVRKGANLTGEVLDKATKPIRETEAFQNVKNVIDDGSSSRYGGWVDKEERRRRREAWEKQNGGKAPEIFSEDPNAGTHVTVHKDAAWKEAWRDFRDSNKFVQGVFGMKNVYQESENPLISTARSITDRVAGFFAENETAQVIKKIRSIDPSFQIEPFLRELREYILPEVLDAYVKGDVETLKLWLSEAQYSVYEALTKQYLQAGLKSDGRILDIRGVDILKARMLEPGEIPVFIITCRTQEVHVYRNAKSGKLAAGMEDKVQLVTYAIGITRIAEDVNNPETRGWRLIEMQKSGRDYY
ncbi:mitochondrial import inner membrane translocase [Echria macrotheca]|uniref:Mitochondrial import inner membrane translocase subunit TIM44 n=1 Tax=Echria macrotheca TaxID=438768 RepID=A0AAJ0FBH9_9PEZI|nr:mitochondrial import inner membrane translocase [Echria macrotheca]